MSAGDKLSGFLAGLLLNQGVKLEEVLGQAVTGGCKKKTANKNDEVDADDEDDEDEDEDEDDEKKDDEEDAPQGLTCEIKNVYQKRDKHNAWVWVNEYPDDIDEPVENKETAKFALIVRNKKSYDTRKKLEIDSIIVQSPVLKKSLEPVLRDYPGVTITLERLTFSAPFAPFVHRWERFLTELEAAEAGSTAKEHMQLLHDVLEAELSDIIAEKKDHVANGVVTFGHMWTIFEPGCLIFGVEDGHERIFRLDDTHTASDRMRGVDYLSVNSWGVDWDGNKFGKASDRLKNYEFSGTMKITQLAAYPLEFHPDAEALKSRLTERGSIFEKFAGYHYMAYKGTALGYGMCGMIRHTVDSRIIIDTDAHNKFVPNKAVRLAVLPRSTDKNSVVRGNTYDSDDCCTDYSDYDSDDDMNTPATSNGSPTPKRRALTPRELLLTVPYVRGYSLKNKKWLWFFLSQIQPIQFNTNAFSSLVLPPQQKDLIHAFVESQIESKNIPQADSFDDIIAGKGRGMVLLLSGPPGVGKTLTAESVAENLQVPLYMMSAGDLGLEPSEIEGSLNTILEMVAKWSAVLLLDEADVFLEARSSNGQDLERNKMVSIFLRVLEYYEGILFLTTNRIKNIDEAFHSRIHVSMQYPALNKESRRHIWETFTGRDKTMDLTSGDLDRLADVDINGRQIKNVLKTARMLAGRPGKKGAEGEDGKLRMEHVRTVLDIERNNKWE